MKWSWKIARIAGIDVYMHATFLILLAWVGLSYWLQRKSLTDAAAGLAFVLALFGIIVLHELGHALMARRFHIKTREITLLPIGGVSRLERMPEDPRQEFLVGIAGPAVNFVLALVFFVIRVSAKGIAGLWDFELVGGDVLANLVTINLTLAVFNLIPAFPMDGGRVLRSLLGMRWDYVQATQAAARIGQAIALVFGFIGLFYNPLLVFIALFVWMGASQEAGMVQVRAALEGLPVTSAMIKDFRTLAPKDSLGRAIEHILAGFQQDFPVADGGKLVGVLTRADLLTGLEKHGREAPVEEVMHRSFETAHPSEMLEQAFARLQSCNCKALPVVRDGSLVGMLTLDNVGELFAIRSALKQAGPEGSRA